MRLVPSDLTVAMSYNLAPRERKKLIFVSREILLPTGDTLMALSSWDLLRVLEIN